MACKWNMAAERLVRVVWHAYVSLAAPSDHLSNRRASIAYGMHEEQ